MSVLRRLVTSGLVAGALVLVAAAAATAHDGIDHPPARPDTGTPGLVGTLIVEHGDDFASGKATFRYGLQTATGRLELRVTGKVPGEPGSRVRVHGRRAGNFVEVANLGDGTALVETIAAAPPASVTKNVAVLLINFTNDTSQPYTAASAQTTVFTNVKNFYTEASYGAMTTTGSVFGWWTIPDDNANCDYNNWATLARNRAAAEGINLSQYTNVVYAFPSAGCGWSGLAQINGPYSWLQGSGGMSTRVAGHELGHNYGDHHAQTAICTDAGGARVSYSANCTFDEYGDPFDIMGGSTRLPNAWHRKQASIMLSSDIQTISGSGTYTFGATSLVDSTPKALRVLRSDGNYWYIEYRIRYGSYDNYTAGAQPTTGVLIRWAPNSSRTQSKLIDANPATTTFSDAAWVPGTEFYDSISNIRLRVESITATSATISLNPSTADTTPPTTPGNFTATQASSSSINLTWTASTDNVGVTGYRVTRDGVQIATPSAGATSYLDTGRTAGVSYGYTIVAFDAAGNASAAATATGSISPADTTPPSAPGTLTATAANGLRVNLAWGAASDNVGVTGYRVIVNGSVFTTVSGSTLSTQVKLGKGTHTIAIAAFDAAGNVGPLSNVRTITL